MGLIVEFTAHGVTREEIDAYIGDGRIPFNKRFHEVQEMPNGNISIFIRNVSTPGLKRKAIGRPYPAELGPIYSFRADIHEGFLPQEGMYTCGEGIHSISAQRVKDVQLGKLKTSVEIIGDDLDKIEQAYLLLRSGKLKPVHDWSSPGTIESPNSDEPKEGSGSHVLPQTAATPKAA
ncbi:MAG: hypothetical protein WCK01_00845 [Candidatus Uhrbacteria bacterium]